MGYSRAVGRRAAHAAFPAATPSWLGGIGERKQFKAGTLHATLVFLVPKPGLATVERITAEVRSTRQLFTNLAGTWIGFVAQP
jgi:hypothetical protein